MKLSEKYSQEDASRESSACAGCGQHKAAGLVVCWSCWQEYKYFDGSLEQFKAGRVRK